MNIKISGPKDFLWTLESEALASNLDYNDKNPLHLGDEPWIELDLKTIKTITSKLYASIKSFLQNRPNAKISIGDVSIDLENVSEEMITSVIDKAIKASERY